MRAEGGGERDGRWRGRGEVGNVRHVKCQGIVMV